MATARTIKRAAFALITAAGLTLAPTVVLADGLTLIDIDCGDGYPISATVDTPTLTKVQGAIQAMVAYPAGLNCSLNTSPVPDPSLNTSLTSSTTTTTDASATGASNPSSPPSKDAFVTGGGRYVSPASNCTVNFAISAHPDKKDPSVAHGTSNVTQPGDCPSGQGHITSKVVCVSVVDNKAEIKSFITKVDGFYEDLGIQENTYLDTDVTDGTSGPDQIVHRWPADNICRTPTGGTHAVTNGNIKVHS